MSRDGSAWARQSALTVCIGLTTWQSVSNVRKLPRITVVRAVAVVPRASLAVPADVPEFGSACAALRTVPEEVKAMSN